MKFFLASIVLFFVILSTPQNSFAHSFGKLYNLPVPFWMYLYGGAASLLVSFLVIGYFFKNKRISENYPTKKLSSLNFIVNRWSINIMKCISVFFLLFSIVSGLIGVDIAYFNINMTLFWILFALLFAYVSALIGNVYSFINPWKTIVEWSKNFLGDDSLFKYPKILGYYPALLFYFAFIWIELLGTSSPRSLSIVLTVYTLINVIGVFLFGKNAWFTYGEFFSVFFRMIGKMAPIEFKNGNLRLRPPFVGLQEKGADHFSLVLFILFMLASTAYDGFRETTIWYRFYWRGLDDIIRPVLGTNSYQVFETIGLFLSPVVFLLIYFVLTFLAKKITNSNLSLNELLLKFAFPLIPIAFVYNIAHYYTLVITEGQTIFRLISDPFGFDWNLFGTANIEPFVQVVDTGFVWHSQVAFILVGHIIGVYTAHVIALKVFPSHKKAILSQIPMLILMVSYTLIGLWILSQPISSGTEF